MTWWIALAIGVQALDVVTTVRALNRGCVEQVWPNTPMMIAGKSASLAVVIPLHRTGHATAAKIVAGSAIANGTFGTVWNLSQRCP